VDRWFGVGEGSGPAGWVTTTVTSTWRVTSCVTVTVRGWHADSSSAAASTIIVALLTSACMLFINSVLLTELHQLQ
jgi:hypothetical protein